MSLSKKTPVLVAAHPETGAIITPRSNPEYASLRLTQEVVSVNNGYINKSKRSAFISGRTEDLKSLNFREGQALGGKIIMRQSFKPFYVEGVNGATKTQDPKINPTTGEIVLTDGSPTYFEFVYTEDLGQTDHWVEEPIPSLANTETTSEVGQQSLAE